MANDKADNRSQLLEEIEEFSRNGPPMAYEPAMPELRREKLEFPDLNQPPAGASPRSATTAPAAPAPILESPSTLGASNTNSLLERLKQEAQSLQETTTQVNAQNALRAALINDGLGAAYRYLDDLVKQLNIIKPAIPKEFVFPGNIVFAGMAWIEGAADFRKELTATEDRRFDNVSARFRIAAQKSIVVERENPKIEPLRKALHDYGVAFEIVERMNGYNIAEHARFTIPCQIKAGFLVKADYAAGNLLLRTRNIDRFGMMEFRLRPEDLNHETLDELTKLFLGEKSRFLTLFRRTA